MFNPVVACGYIERAFGLRRAEAGKIGNPPKRCIRGVGDSRHQNNPLFLVAGLIRRIGELVDSAVAALQINPIDDVVRAARGFEQLDVIAENVGLLTAFWRGRK